MPARPERFCPGRGGACGALVTGGLCADCQAQKHQRYSERKGWSAHGYGPRWERWRATVIRVHRLRFCGDRPPSAPHTTNSRCLQARQVSAGVVMNHIVRVSGPTDPRLFDESNVEFLCRDCDQRNRGRQSHQPRLAS